MYAINAAAADADGGAKLPYPPLHHTSPPAIHHHHHATPHIASQRRRSGTLDFYSSLTTLRAGTIAHPLPPRPLAASNRYCALASKGYPQTVAPEYLRYSLLTNASIGDDSAAADADSASRSCAPLGSQGGSAATGAALAGTLNWVLKDGIGQLAAIVSASVIFRSIRYGCEAMADDRRGMRERRACARVDRAGGRTCGCSPSPPSRIWARASRALPPRQRAPPSTATSHATTIWPT